MSRFYKTTKAEFLEDNMYQPPIDLMTKVLATVGDKLDKQEEEAYALKNKLVADGLDVDKPRLQQIISDYSSKIDDIAYGIQQDPLSYRNRTAEIRNLGRQISHDWSSQGEVGVIQANKALRENFVKEHLERVKAKEGRVLQQDVTNAQNLFDKMYNAKGGAQYKSSTQYNQYLTESLNPFADINEVADKVGKDWEADMTSRGYANVGGQWIRKGTNGTEIADEKEIRSAIITRINSDPELVNYYRQQLQYGFITPEELNKRITDAANVYSSKYGYTKHTSTQDIDSNPYSIMATQDAYNTKQKYLSHDLDKKFEDYKANVTALMEIGTSSKSTFLTPEQFAAQNKSINETIGTLAGKLGVNGISKDGRYNLAGIRENLVDMRKRAEKNGDKKTLQLINGYWQDLQRATSMMNKTEAEASWASGLQILQPKQLLAAKKDFNEVLKDPGQMGNIKQTWRINGKAFYNTSINDIYKNPTKYNLPKTIFSTNDLQLKDIYNQGSVRPVIMSGTDYNLNSMNTTWNIPGVDMESNVPWTKVGISTNSDY